MGEEHVRPCHPLLTEERRPVLPLLFCQCRHPRLVDRRDVIEGVFRDADSVRGLNNPVSVPGVAGGGSRPVTSVDVPAVGGGGFGGAAAATYRSMAPATAANPVGRLPWEQSNYDDDEDIYGPSGLLPPRRQESAWQPDEEWTPRGAVRSAEVAAWLREAGVLPLLLGECLHEELLRRAEPLLGALIEHGAL